jgi:hypothetical protein
MELNIVYPNPIESNNLSITVHMELKIVYPSPIESINLSITVHMELKIVYPSPIESNNMSITVHMKSKTADLDCLSQSLWKCCLSQSDWSCLSQSGWSCLSQSGYGCLSKGSTPQQQLLRNFSICQVVPKAAFLLFVHQIKQGSQPTANGPSAGHPYVPRSLTASGSKHHGKPPTSRGHVKHIKVKGKKGKKGKKETYDLIVNIDLVSSSRVEPKKSDWWCWCHLFFFIWPKSSCFNIFASMASGNFVLFLAFLHLHLQLQLHVHVHLYYFVVGIIFCNFLKHVAMYCH